MVLKRIPLNELSGLKTFHEGGEQGIIYIDSSGMLVKIYQHHDPKIIDSMSTRLELMSRHANSFYGLSHFCALPDALVLQPGTAKPIGFRMKNFPDFQPLNLLLDKPFCIKQKITIRKVTQIFLSIHDHISKIHRQGFLIGDLADENVLFGFKEKSVLLGFIDTDSWSFKHDGEMLPVMAITPSFCHPELIENPEAIAQYHDWYSYSVLLARSLIKADPFNYGEADVETMRVTKGKLKKHGITCWDQHVTLSADKHLFAFRFGEKLIGVLQKWLGGKERGVFPKEVLEKFLANLAFCKNCSLEVHLDLQNCPRCSKQLKSPASRNDSHIAKITPIPEDPDFFSRLSAMK